jgi:hypothetical protein
MYLLHLKSRNQFRWERYGETFARNFRTLAGCDEDTVAHPDTLATVLERLEVNELAELLAELVRRLIRMKALDDERVRGCFLVAVDGTGFLSFDYPHCPHCLRMEHASGKVTYQHPVLAAFLVCGNGLALPLAVEFVENPSQPFDKQDCELKAFKRLSQRLKALFPQTPFCLLLDALYAAGSVMTICEQNQWKYTITFKESDMPALWREAVTLRDLSQNNDRTFRYLRPVKTLRTRWVNNLEHQGHRLSSLFQDEITDEGTQHFAHLSNWLLDAENVESSAAGARQRWRIENEGFNVLKNGGFDLQHAYSRNFQAAKNYFHLMLIAHTIQQLMVRGSLFTRFGQQLGSWRNFARRLAMALHHDIIPNDTLPPTQIRFCSA